MLIKQGNLMKHQGEVTNQFQNKSAKKGWLSTKVAAKPLTRGSSAWIDLPVSFLRPQGWRVGLLLLVHGLPLSRVQPDLLWIVRWIKLVIPACVHAPLLFPIFPLLPTFLYVQGVSFCLCVFLIFTRFLRCGLVCMFF